MAGLLRESIATVAPSQGSALLSIDRADCKHADNFRNPTFPHETISHHTAVQGSLRGLHTGYSTCWVEEDRREFHTRNYSDGQSNGQGNQANEIERLRHKTTPAVVSMIACNGEVHQEETYDYIDGDVALVALLKSCGEQKDLSNGKRIHGHIVRGFLQVNVFVSSTLISMYAKCGALEEAQDVFDELPVRNVVSWNVLITGYAQYGDLDRAQGLFDELPCPCVISWNALIAGYVQHGRSKDALSCFEHMQLAGFLPNEVTFACVLKACGCTGTLEEGQKIHVDISKRSFPEKDFVLASALIDMYAKCGALDKARKVFEELPIRNVATWNTLIAGYVRQGEGEEALRCYKQMQLHGFSPTVITFTSILKACGSIGTLDEGQKVHACLLKRCLLEEDTVVANALVDMYAKCGMLQRARGVFSELPVRDLVLWTGLIAGYARHGQGEKALACYEQMQSEGLAPDTATLACILKACGSIGALDKGQEIHAKIVKDCFLDNQVSNSLIDMYAKCEALKKAEEVFDSLATRDTVSWNALMAGYTQRGEGEKALNLYGQMQQQGFAPSVLTFTCVLAACGNKQALDKGQHFHALFMRETLPENDVMVINAIVDMYAQCGAFDEARGVFDDVEVHDVTLWNVLIAEYARREHVEDAMKCFEQMQLEGCSPDAVTFARMLKSFGSIGALAEGQSIHALSLKEFLTEKDDTIGAALVFMYAKCGALDKAQAIFDELFVWDLAVWNAMIAGYSQHGHGEKAYSYFQRMQLAGFCPNAVSFASVLKACGLMRALEKGKEVHARCVGDSSLQNDMVVGTALVDMYSKCGAPETAHQVFEELPSRDVVSWNALIAGYAQHELGEEALAHFERMQLEGFQAEAATYACSLDACGSVGAADKGQRIHTDIVRRGLFENNSTDVGTALVVMYARCGMLAEARSLFDKLPVQDVVSWSALIEGYAQSGQDAVALSLFERMLRKGIAPNSITLTVVLNACNHRGLLDKGQSYFETISDCYGITPTADHHTCMVDLFARSGHFDKAIAVIREMPVYMNGIMWLTLLGACQRVGLSELGRWAFEHAVQLDARGAAVFVGMSNIYAAEGNQEVAGRAETKSAEEPFCKELGHHNWNDIIEVSCLSG